VLSRRTASWAAAGVVFPSDARKRGKAALQRAELTLAIIASIPM